MSATSSTHDELFMATISHELRGPLHAILGLSEVLLASDLTEGDARLAAALHREASAMRVLVDDVVAYGQFSSTAPTLKEAPFAPRMLVTSIVDRLRSSAEESGLRLLVEFDPAVPLRVLGDAVRFGQVVDNLVGNAIRYTEVGSVQVVLAADADTLSVQVRDTGVGINPNDLERIFDPFVRVGNSAVRGTGLGLAVVQRISEPWRERSPSRARLELGPRFCSRSRSKRLSTSVWSGSRRFHLRTELCLWSKTTKSTGRSLSNNWS